jgi:6-phosphogluconolactonase
MNLEMSDQDIQRNAEPRKTFSRRALLKQSASMTLLCAAHHATRAFAIEGKKRRILAYVGTYNHPVDGGGGNGKGIYLFEMDPVTGKLTLVKLAAEARNPSWLALDASGRYLYSVNEVADYEGNGGAVSAYAVNRTTGDLQLLNVVRSEGAGPAHLSIDASGKYVLVANYNGGTVAVLPILSTGALGPASDVHHDVDSVGSSVPSSAPGGSYAFSGHDRTHAHMIGSDPGGRFVLHTDLGQDRIYVDSFDSATGKLSSAANPPFVSLPSGDGPRHFVFHKNGKWLYSLQEEASTIAFFLFDPATGSLRFRQTISTLPPDFKGTSFTSEILISPDGRFLYAANRLHDTIAVFSIGADGRLSYRGETETHCDYPRHLNIDPSGMFLYSCNQRSDDITSFRISRQSGLLSFTGQYTAIGSPACIVFLSTEP